MDAEPLLGEILKAMHKHRLEAILIGNAGAALHGAPVTTLDFDFMFRETPANLRKLKAVSRVWARSSCGPAIPCRSSIAW